MTRQGGGTGPYLAFHARSHQGRPIAAVARSLALVAAFVLVAGCTPISAIENVVSVVAKPVLGLAVKDARTTLTWIEGEEKAGRLSPVDVDLAKRCPEAVVALDTLRTRMVEGTVVPDSFKGLIYFGTKNRFGQGVQAEASRYLSQLAQDCLPLIPAEKLIKVF